MSVAVASPRIPVVVLGSRRSKPEWARSLLLDHATSAGTAAASGYTKMEKSRQLFLRSYHFSRKKSSMEKLRSSVVRLTRRVWVRVCSVRRLPLLLWFRLRSCAWYGNWRRMRRRRMRFHCNFHPWVVHSNHDGHTPAIYRGDWSS